MEPRIEKQTVQWHNMQRTQKMAGVKWAWATEEVRDIHFVSLMTINDNRPFRFMQDVLT